MYCIVFPQNWWLIRVAEIPNADVCSIKLHLIAHDHVRSRLTSCGGSPALRALKYVDAWVFVFKVIGVVVQHVTRLQLLGVR